MLITDATNLPRLMNCNGSRLMQADPVFTVQDDTVRNEGNAAHWLASVVFAKQHTVDELVDRKAPNGVFITREMADHVEEYLTAIGSAGEMEWSYSISGVNWQVNGRADRVKHIHELDGTTTLHIPDFKYGYSIVEPRENWTLLSHAIGFCLTNRCAPTRIKLEIHQPRAPHRDGRVREWELTYPELLQRYNHLSATLANPSDILQTGKHCYKCPAFGSCPARQDAELNCIETAHVAFNAHISNHDLAERRDQIERAQELLKQSAKVYDELIMTRVKQGQIVANYSLENDLTNRLWVDGMTVELMAALTGRDISKRSLPNLKDAIEAFGEDFVNTFTTRKSKGTKLVRVNADKKATKLFGKKG